MRLRSLFMALGIASSPMMVDAQVSKVNYKVQFNEKTNLFDCYLLVKEGSAKSTRDRAQFNAQFTLVVPNGSEVKMAESFMPLQNNQKYNSTSPSHWIVTNHNISPEADPFRDFVSIVPSLSPTSFYNDLEAGTEVKLFSVSITPVIDCGSTVRMYEKGLDPESADRGMGGGDFANGFTLGSVSQIYDGNTPMDAQELSLVKNVKANVLKGKLSLEADLELDGKYGPYSYVWNGPNDFKAYSEDVIIYNPTFINEGSYVLEVSDSRGCKQVKNLEARVNGVTIGTGNDGNESIIKEATIGVYPNPATNFFNLDIQAKDGSAVSMELLDSKGGVILSKSYGVKLKNNHINETFNLAAIPAGMYSVAVTIDGQITSKQVIVLK
jgi:hypothetical protein